MLETPHAVVGAAIAAQIPNPAIAIPLAFASHFLLDKMPHWNPHLRTELRTTGKVSNKSTLIIAVDVLIATISTLAIAYQASSNSTHTITILAAALAAILPDIVEGPYFFLGIKSKIVEKWLKFQSSIQFDVAPLPGVVIQICVVIVALAIASYS